MTKRPVFLVPGFFGFSFVGAVKYFDDVERALGSALRRRGVDARIVPGSSHRLRLVGMS